VKVKLAVKPGARHRGGINLFGRKFGNYPQDLVMRIAYDIPSGIAVDASIGAHR